MEGVEYPRRSNNPTCLAEMVANLREILGGGGVEALK
jgi:hypothetical protein